VLVGLTQVGAKDSALKITVICASVALPAWLMLGAIFEYYIFLGKESYPHLRTNSVNRFLQLWMFVGGAGTFGATLGTIWFLMPEAAYAFLALSFGGVVAALLF